MKTVKPDYLGRLRRHQRRMQALVDEATYYEQSGYPEFAENARRCWEAFAEMEKAESELLANVRREAKEREMSA